MVPTRELGMQVRIPMLLIAHNAICHGGITLELANYKNKMKHLYDQVTKVARILAAKPAELEGEQKSCTIMALLDGGTLRRHKSWIKVLYFTFVFEFVMYYVVFAKHIFKQSANGCCFSFYF